MKRVELTIRLALLENLGVLNERFFRHNEAVESSGPSVTARLRDMLVLAHRLGSYDTPAKVSLDRGACLVGITKAALSRRLWAAELTAALGSIR